MRTITLSLLMLGTSLSATAQPEDYTYGGFQLGLSGAVDDNLRGVENSNLDLHLDKEIGYVTGLYIGRNVDKWRYELEYALRENSIDTVFVNNPDRLNLVPGLAQGGGSQKTDSFMGNVHYNFANIDDWKAFVGAGIGMSRVQLENVTAGGVGVASSRNWEPAGQVMLQLTKAFGGLEFGIGARHFRTTRGDFGTAARKASYRFVHNEVFARVSWKFGEKSQPAPQEPAPVAVAQPTPPPVVQQPAPAPEPVPEPAPAPMPGPFMVFFDFDKSALTADAQSIVERAAGVYREFGGTRINAVGHTDRAGANRYNDALAMRRAEAVKAALIAEGVPASRISIRAEGETSPMVATDDGVREWQNRRVEIIISR